jgi:hypothetical protein
MPHWMPARVVDLAARMLPAVRRSRYQRECAAELLTRTLALRAALQTTGTSKDPIPRRFLISIVKSYICW